LAECRKCHWCLGEWHNGCICYYPTHFMLLVWWQSWLNSSYHQLNGLLRHSSHDAKGLLGHAEALFFKSFFVTSANPSRLFLQMSRKDFIQLSTSSEHKKPAEATSVDEDGSPPSPPSNPPTRFDRATQALKLLQSLYDIFLKQTIKRTSKEN
jgi:hypothetical protein